jgi:hypothetical protein
MNRRTFFGALLGATVAAAAHGAPAHAATTYYVATNGSDSASGTAAAPWRTIAKAAATASAGSTVLVKAGAYAENVTLARSGASGSPITFKANGADAVKVSSFTVNASYATISGFQIGGSGNAGVTVAAGRTAIAIANNVISGTGRDGVRFLRPPTPYSSAGYTRGVQITNNRIANVGTSNAAANDLTIYANDVTVDGNDLTGSRNDAVNMWGDRHTYTNNRIHDISNSVGHHDDAFQTWTGNNDGADGIPVTNLTVRRNQIENITGSNAHGFMAHGPGHANWTIRDNLFRNTGSQAMILAKTGGGTQGIKNVVIGGNTFVSAGSANTIELNLTTTGVVSGNIFYNCRGWGGRPPYYIGSAAGVTANYNLSGGTSPKVTESRGINADPKFVNPASDWRLAAGSPAIDSGDDGALISPVRTVDRLGMPTVGVVDRGAYEAQG